MKILLAVDGSSASEAAVDVVRSRPWPSDSAIRVLSVAEPAYPLPPPAATAVPAGGLAFGVPPYQDASMIAVQERLDEQAKTTAQAVAATLHVPGVRVEALAPPGNPRDVIVDQAATWGADLIVLGSHGRTGLRRWILGSVAEAVVRHAPCSVEVARARAERTSSRSA